ncbi:MAG: hypothetical protein ACI9BW_002774 [Gammaproteobacteria bacterium]|jgi:hypothetical protein
MSDKPITYEQLLETNTLIQQLSDETYWLCLTRTVQESKLFPVSPYMLLSYMMAFYRYPELLRKIDAAMPAQEIGDRARNMGIKIQNPSMGWGLSFYLLGRELLINMGLLRPQDALDDLICVMDFWKRFQLAWHRNDGHITNAEFGHRGQFLPERRLQVFHADMHECRIGDPLHTAAQAFMAAASQYGFLISCESRVSLHNSGPYKLSASREMIVRDYMDLSESDFPWLDDVAVAIPYNNLTVPMAVEGCHFNLIDDWGSFESEPEFKAEHVVAVGLYTSDVLTEGYMPVAMATSTELTAAFTDLTEKIKDATMQLWRRIAGWSRDQMIDAGAMVYFGIVKDLAHVAGVYAVEDWMMVDERAERFRPLFNDEYSNAALGELVGTISNPSQQLNPYTMMKHSDAPTRLYSLIPYSILADGDFTRTCGAVRPGITHLPDKVDRYTTSQGVLGLGDYNRRARQFVPKIMSEKYRHLCETWVKYNYDTALADELYCIEQSDSRLLKGQGAGLTLADIEQLRQSAAET